VLAAFPMAWGLAEAQIVQSQSVQGGCGCVMTNGTLTCRTAGGQAAAGVIVSSDGESLVTSGFLASVILFPLLDTDADGLCDEMDQDNDGDSFPDVGELNAGTDTTNAASLLAVVGVDRLTDGVRVRWTGGVNSRQVLYRCDSLRTGQWKPLATNLPPAPVASLFDDRSAAGRSAFYRVAADRPDR
jgi:hypothetical protein